MMRATIRQIIIRNFFCEQKTKQNNELMMGVICEGGKNEKEHNTHQANTDAKKHTEVIVEEWFWSYNRSMTEKDEISKTVQAKTVQRKGKELWLKSRQNKIKSTIKYSNHKIIKFYFRKINITLPSVGATENYDFINRWQLLCLW